jgi:hypothetical protein
MGNGKLTIRVCTVAGFNNEHTKENFWQESKHDCFCPRSRTVVDREERRFVTDQSGVTGND